MKNNVSSEHDESVEQKTQWDADTVELVAWLLRGKSLVDFAGPAVKTPENLMGLLKRNGYEIKNAADKEELDIMINEAIAFCERLFKNLASRNCLTKDLPPKVHEDLLMMSMKEIFQVAAGTYSEEMHPSVVKQACVIVKVILIISYLNRAPNYIYQEHAFRELNKWKRENFSSTKHGGWALTRLTDSTPEIYLKQVSTDKKSKESLIRKLMTKDDVTASKITDFVRTRIVVKTPLDLIRLLYVFVKENRVPWNLTITEEPKQELIDFKTLKDLMENANTAEKFCNELLGNPTIVNGLKYEKKKNKPKDKTNEHSSEKFKCISWAIEFSIIIETKDADGNWIKTRMNYPIEFQFADEETARKNWRKDSDIWDEVNHEEYRNKQKDKIGARLSITTKEIKAIIGEDAIEKDIKQFMESAERLDMPKNRIAELIRQTRNRIVEISKSR
ncbi:TIGR04552 family protein [Candidatus Peregrinibacteria bacterium]|nr:TIGR04552 family protein [Candidatus Peregrinibacteria bacterium]